MSTLFWGRVGGPGGPDESRVHSVVSTTTLSSWDPLRNLSGSRVVVDHRLGRKPKQGLRIYTLAQVAVGPKGSDPPSALLRPGLSCTGSYSVCPTDTETRPGGEGRGGRGDSNRRLSPHPDCRRSSDRSTDLEI